MRNRILRVSGYTAICSIPLVLGLVACDRGTPSSSSARTRTTTPDNSSRATAPDNTQRNARDRDGTTLTPGDQGESAADRTISAEIRQSVMARSDLSTDAHNVKIITKDGVVTLRGPVADQAEKDAIAAMAQNVPGVKSVVNELEIKS
jgi:hypothetical protein